MPSIWLDDQKVLEKLKDIMFNAYTSDPLWNPIKDFSTQLSAVKTWWKMRNDQTADVVVQIANIFPNDWQL